MHRLIIFITTAFVFVSSLSASLSDGIQSSLICYQSAFEDNVVFLDTSSVLQKKDALTKITNNLYEHYKDADFDVVLGFEVNGIMLASILAYRLNKPLAVVQRSFTSNLVDLEYTRSHAIRKDSLKAHQKVLIISDFLSTCRLGVYNTESDLPSQDHVDRNENTHLQQSFTNPPMQTELTVSNIFKQWTLFEGTSVQSIARLIRNTGADVFEAAVIVDNRCFPLKEDDEKFDFPVYALVNMIK